VNRAAERKTLPGIGCSDLLGVSGFIANRIGLLGALPDFVVRVANPNLGHGIALDLDGELETLPVIFHPG
jgi:hypothetical protein